MVAPRSPWRLIISLHAPFDVRGRALFAAAEELLVLDFELANVALKLIQLFVDRVDCWRKGHGAFGAVLSIMLRAAACSVNRDGASGRQSGTAQNGAIGRRCFDRGARYFEFRAALF